MSLSLDELTCHAEFLLGNIDVFIFFIIRPDSYGSGTWNLPLWMTMTHLSCIINTMVADDLVTKKKYLSEDIPILAPEGLGHIDGLLQERHNSNALAMEFRLCCTNPSILTILKHVQRHKLLSSCIQIRLHIYEKHGNILYHYYQGIYN